MCVCARAHVCLPVGGCFKEQYLSCYTRYSPGLEIQPAGKKTLSRPSQVAEPGNLLMRQTLTLPSVTVFAEKVYSKRLKRTEVRAKKEWLICPRLGRRSCSPFPLMPRGIWRACRITQVRRDHRRALVKPPA